MSNREEKMTVLEINKPDGTKVVYAEGEHYSFGDLLLRFDEAWDNDWEARFK